MKAKTLILMPGSSLVSRRCDSFAMDCGRESHALAMFFVCGGGRATSVPSLIPIPPPCLVSDPASRAARSNPLVMAAGVSRDLKLAERASPMHRGGLRRLQLILDNLTNEVRAGRSFASNAAHDTCVYLLLR